MKLKLIGIHEVQQAAVAELSDQLKIVLAETGIPVQVKRGKRGISLKYDGAVASISFEEEHQFFRALGLLAEHLSVGAEFEISEVPTYDSLGVMIDCSRNAVLHYEAYCKLIRSLALMGYSTVQMYTEDTYEMKEYPYFGYMRGKYSAQELEAMDHYAAQFGIELVPSIQTLAHLGSALRWSAHADLVDCNDILLIDDPATYELIDCMFRTMSVHVASRKINIGMDEAHMMGLGKYLDKHGYQDRSSLMLKHFDKVMKIARKYGYEPMMWSDMFFRLASSGEYYDMESKIRKDIVQQIPSDITLVYWDYYSETQEKYNGMLAKHKQLSDKIVFAGGAWKWMGFTPNNQFSKHIASMAHQACVDHGIKDVLMTAWGDNGAECSLFAILPVLQLWAELNYAHDGDEERLHQRMITCVNGEYEDFMALDLANLVPDNAPPGRLMGNQVNPQKYILYQDVLYGLFDKHIDAVAYSRHFRESADILAEAAGRNGQWSEIFETQVALCRLLEIKSTIGIELREAYVRNDKQVLAHHCEVTLPELRGRAVQFISSYRKQWLKENKIFGLDAFDIRMGGLLQRIDTAIYRINDWVTGKVAVLEELEQERLYFDHRFDHYENKVISANLWHTIATPSVIAGV